MKREEKKLKMIIKILRAYLRLSSRTRISSEHLFVLVEHGAVLIFMDDARVSTIKYGAIKQFHHYKIQMHTYKQTPETHNASQTSIESNNSVLTVWK